MGGFGLIISKKDLDIPDNVLKKVEASLKHRGKVSSSSVKIDKGIYALQTVGIRTKKNTKSGSFCIEKINDYFILSDVRLDNRKDLDNKYHIDPTITDSKAILEIYLKINNKVFQEIEGPFSFVIFNKANNKVIAARDVFGQKPFYFINNKDFFMVCSEIDSIFCLGLKKVVNKKKLAQIIIQDYQRDSYTIFKSIKKLHGGYCLKFYENKLTLRRYHKFPSKVSSFKDFNQTVQNFSKIFESVIKGQIYASNSNIGSTLSGGLDSSSISIIADKYKRHTLNTYSVQFNGLNKEESQLVDEKKYVSEVLKIIDSNHAFINLFLKKDGPLLDLEKKYKKFQFPFLIINGYLHQSIYNKCNEDGVNYLFDGLFGDEIISHGTYRLSELLNKGNFFRFFFEVWYLKKNNVIYSMKSAIKIYLLKPLKIKIKNIFIFNPSRKVKNKISDDLSNILSDRYKLKKTIKKYQSRLERKFESEYIEQLHFYESGIIEHSLEQLDFMATRLNIEPIYPFLDKRIVNFCLRIPTKFKLKNGITRYYFKESMKNVFPEKLYNRHTKANISPFTKFDINTKFHDKLCNVEDYKGIISDIVYFEKIKKKKSASIQLSAFNIISLHQWLKNIHK